jgi:ribosomal protein S24E
LEILSDSENKLLSRRELLVTFGGGNGFITRQSAAEAVSNRLGIPKDKVRVLYLQGKFGIRDLTAKVYVYENVEAIKEQLPKYLEIRDLPKEERKKAREALKPKPGKPAEPEKKA